MLHTRLRVAATAATLAAAGIAASSASAHGPIGSCPGPYELFAIADAPAFAQPGLTAIDQQGNGDGYVCRYDNGNPKPGFNFIDNHDVGKAT
jgi:hypothetical protein